MGGIVRAGRLAGPTLALIGLLAGCGEDRPPATGAPDDIVVAADPALTRQIQRRVAAALAPPLFAVADAETFQLSFQDPAGEGWPTARTTAHVLLVGRAEDAAVAEALAEAADAPDSVPAPPALLELHDVWAAGQEVIVLLVPSENPARAVYAQLDTLAATYQRRYREGVVATMFEQGPNRALSDSLMESYGFDLYVPKDYAWTTEGDVFLFRKEGSESGEGVRHVTVTWRSPIPAGMQGDGLLAWRSELAAAHYGSPQRVALDASQASQTTHQGNVTYQMLGNWSGTGTGRAQSGPFILRAEICPTQDRMYLLDGWLYAPDQDQHAYLVELESILNSFRCGSARSAQ